MNRFEQLIEYVINDEEAKARELFHEIVVEKSRQIYENLMAEEIEEADQELDEAAEEEVEEGAMGGDAADDLIDEVEMDEESGISMEEGDDDDADADDAAVDADDAMDAGDEINMDVEGSSSEAATKDDIMNLEDKLDELMAEFEQLMGAEEAEHADMDSDMDGDGDDFDMQVGGDDIAADDTAEMEPMAEAVNLKAAPKPVTSEEGSVNKKAVNNDNSGRTGMAGKPVHVTGDSPEGKHDTPAYKNSTKDLISDFQNKAGASMKDMKAAPKPVTAQASGVNARTPFPKG